MAKRKSQVMKFPILDPWTQCGFIVKHPRGFRGDRACCVLPKGHKEDHKTLDRLSVEGAEWEDVFAWPETPRGDLHESVEIRVKE